MKYAVFAILAVMNLSHNSIICMNKSASVSTPQAETTFKQTKLAQYLTRLLAAPTLHAFDAIYTLIVHDKDVCLDEATLFALAFCRINVPKN